MICLVKLRMNLILMYSKLEILLPTIEIKLSSPLSTPTYTPTHPKKKTILGNTLFYYYAWEKIIIIHKSINRSFVLFCLQVSIQIYFEYWSEKGLAGFKLTLLSPKDFLCLGSTQYRFSSLHSNNWSHYFSCVKKPYQLFSYHDYGV